MLGAGSDGAWQLCGRVSVVPGGHSWPGWMRVPPRMPWAARPTATVAVSKMIKAFRRIFMGTILVVDEVLLRSSGGAPKVLRTERLHRRTFVALTSNLR